MFSVFARWQAFFCSCELSRKDIVSKYISLKCSFEHKNSRGMAINMLVEKLCREEEVGFVDLWGSFVRRADMYMKDWLHLSGKGAAVFAEGLAAAAAVDSGMGSITNIFGSQHYLN